MGSLKPVGLRRLDSSLIYGHMLWNEVMAFMGIYRWHVESLNNIYCVRHSTALAASVLAQMIKQTSGYISEEKWNLSQGHRGHSASRMYRRLEELKLSIPKCSEIWWLIAVGELNCGYRIHFINFIILSEATLVQIFVFAEAASVGCRNRGWNKGSCVTSASVGKKKCVLSRIQPGDWCSGCTALPHHQRNILRETEATKAEASLAVTLILFGVYWCISQHIWATKETVMR